MKEAFLQYLKLISSRALIERIDKIISDYSSFFSEEILDIFVSEYIKEDGTREYESLWLFAENYIMEAKQFPNKDDFDITPLKNHIHYIVIDKQDYEFGETSEKSRLNIYFVLDNDIDGKLKGSKENCYFLNDIYRKHILPNLKK